MRQALWGYEKSFVRGTVRCSLEGGLLWISEKDGGILFLLDFYVAR